MASQCAAAAPRTCCEQLPGASKVGVRGCRREQGQLGLCCQQQNAHGKGQVTTLQDKAQSQAELGRPGPSLCTQMFLACCKRRRLLPWAVRKPLCSKLAALLAG